MEEASESEKLLLLRQELEPYLELFEKAYVKVVDSGYSRYPIIVVHQDHINIGIPLLLKKTSGGSWNVHISKMEEFVTKRLIRQERLEEFQSLYERKKDHYCLFVLSDFGAKFVFLPRIPDATS
jgi:hypothetical protein